MLKKCSGFFLVELFLSLTVWMLISLTLLPLYIHVSKQSLDMNKDITANHVLYESLHRYLLEGDFENGDIKRENEWFRIFWEKEVNIPVKVCVKYENSFEQEKEKCERLE
ncbi:competence type IV pilus minor pilin ComGE [Robertmurraya massiliosenegalensis]|uniref:competence type IV pilus minor pilin ComGE n=1 Tax=Robertmurraya massiliosenegalensis TaxID=1287657 RepID=UPI00037D639A|nr:competence type IV pilus minor pilin ComGE [Robertmurraya massiliosenegalensis]